MPSHEHRVALRILMKSFSAHPTSQNTNVLLFWRNRLSISTAFDSDISLTWDSEMTLLRRACVSPCWYSIQTMSVSRTVSEILNIKQTGVRVVQGHWKCRRSIDHIRFLLVGHCKYSSILYNLRLIWRWIIVTLKRRSRPFKLVPFESLGAVSYSLHSNYGRIFNRLWDIQRQIIAWPWKLG